MEEYIFRNATINDIPFLVDTIIEAEKSGTDKLSYSTIFGLSEDDVRKYLSGMLLEEVDGCELSISSFILAIADKRIVAAIAAWIEGCEGLPSTVLKGNLLNYSLPREAMNKALANNLIVRDFHIEYAHNTIQIGLVYVDKAYRGQNLVSLLMEQQISNLLLKGTNPTAVYLQVFGNNVAAIRAYEKVGFSKVLTKKSTQKDALLYMPSDSKILMKRELK